MLVHYAHVSYRSSARHGYLTLAIAYVLCGRCADPRRIEHDPDPGPVSAKWVRFSLATTRSVCAEMMLNEKIDGMTIRRKVIALQHVCYRARSSEHRRPEVGFTSSPVSKPLPRKTMRGVVLVDQQGDAIGRAAFCFIDQRRRA